MKRFVGFFAALLLMGLATAVPAGATIGFSQQVRLRDDLGPYRISYSSLERGYKSCSSCSGNEPTGSGSMTVVPRTYRLVESNRTYDYYLVDLTVSVSGHTGPRDAGTLNAQITSVGAVNYATYSSGHSETAQNCHTYTVTIGAAWGPLSVGTDVGTYSTCVHSSISRRAVKAGQHYSMTNLNGIKQVTFQRFVRVKAKTLPKFKVSLSWPTGSCIDTQLPSGTLIDCYASPRSSRSWTIGTTG